MTMEKKQHHTRDQLILVLLAPLLIVLIPLILVAYVMLMFLIYCAVWISWNTRGINLLYVHSNSPNWQDHIQTSILPRLPKNAIVLNWSERRNWTRMPLASLVFRHIGGYRAFNPMAVIIRPLRTAKVFRFHRAFMDRKHGHPESLAKLEGEFFEELKK